MAKSKGNFFTVRDIAKTFDYEVIRFFMLSAHYRSPINFSAELLEQAKNGLERIYNCIDNLEYLKEHAQVDKMTESERELEKRLLEIKAKFIEAWMTISIRQMLLLRFLIL
ncbi:cysteinyl-tRNA synthetase [Acetivibrio straminisolvens JCM 21531]|uniref:Cysteinyl-tRNA synthetase n=1 Tax=Acetivibrio straminisolvens JCM 21531 TaxID=1294263 RepID=W4V8E3_9FIRM|nr:cysteinyl-tRNA synthetase [Acetivibrio straminisolvens JCM 21531]